MSTISVYFALKDLVKVIEEQEPNIIKIWEDYEASKKDKKVISMTKCIIGIDKTKDLESQVLESLPKDIPEEIRRKIAKEIKEDVERSKNG